MNLIYAALESGVAACVILNGEMIYSEDDDKGYHQNFTAWMVAEQLGKALGVPVRAVAVKYADLPGDEEPGNSWTFDDIVERALAS
jgi:hypothetical protein